jgi:nucleoid-associated protein YgaU
VDDFVGAAAGWVALAGLAYLMLGVAAAVAAQRRRNSALVAERLLLLYPRFARVALRAFAIAAVGLGSAPATSAFAADHTGGSGPRPPVVAPQRPAAEPLDWPGASPQSHRHVTVQSGDCLWSLAARALGPDATSSEVAAAWPRWWAANRDLIGTDPDLLRPGLRLRVPTSVERSAS